MDVLMPQLGETVAEGKITQWFKSTGEAIKPGDNLFEIETDKVSMEVPSTATGVLAEIRVPAGDGGSGRRCRRRDRRWLGAAAHAHGRLSKRRGASPRRSRMSGSAARSRNAIAVSDAASDASPHPDQARSVL